MKSLVITIILSAFATTVAAAAPNDNKAAAQTACGSDSIKFDVKRTHQHAAIDAKPDQATLYVFSDMRASTLGCGVVTRVGLDGKWIGANCGSSYVSLAVDAGEHHLCSNWQTKVFYHPQPVSLSSFTAEPGHTYYFRALVLLDSDKSSAIDLEPINADEGRMLASSQPSSLSQPKH
jgi:hypothetical protein